MEEPTIIKPTEVKCDFDWEEHERRYPKQQQHCIERKIVRPADGLMLRVGQCITDIPVDQRHRYMWIVPDDMKDHPCYKEKDWGGRMIRECENEKKKREKDKEDKIDQQERTIQTLVDHVARLTEAVNKLTKGQK